MAGLISIRIAAPDDAPHITPLLEELGYVSTLREVKDRLEHASSDPQQAVFVAEAPDIAGWIQVVRVLTIENGFCCEIRGLVVARTRRHLGIGRKLVEESERWAMARRCGRIRVRTNIVRSGAQAFYANLGYSVSKTQRVFDKLLR